MSLTRTILVALRLAAVTAVILLAKTNLTAFATEDCSGCYPWGCFVAFQECDPCNWGGVSCGKSQYCDYSTGFCEIAD
jgi:hypothetical protein